MPAPAPALKDLRSSLEVCKVNISYRCSHHKTVSMLFDFGNRCSHRKKLDGLAQRIPPLGRPRRAGRGRTASARTVAVAFSVARSRPRPRLAEGREEGQEAQEAPEEVAQARALLQLRERALPFPLPLSQAPATVFAPASRKEVVVVPCVVLARLGSSTPAQPAPARLCQRDPDLVRNPSPDPWSLEAPPPSADQQQRILMERAAARAQSARSLPLGFGTVPSSLPSGFGARAQAAPPLQGNAYQRGVIRCAACLVDRYPLRLWDNVRSSDCARRACSVEHSR
jgi:hypothetical protein